MWVIFILLLWFAAPSIHAQPQASIYLDPVPELDEISVGALEVTPASYANWAALFTANPNVQEIVLTEGDYTSWGKLTMGPTGGAIEPINGTAEQRIVLRYLDSTPPWARADQAEIVGVELLDTSYWIVTGMYVTGTGQLPLLVRETAQNIIFHENLIHTPQYGIGLYGPNNTAQRNYLQDQDSVGNDGPAIHIQVIDVNNPPINSKVLNNEIRNWNDGVHLQDDAANPSVAINGAIIDGNDIYLNSAKYLQENGGEYADAENALDFKVGSDDPDNLMLVINNRMWGFRNTAPSVTSGGKSSNGATITNHRMSRNVLFEGNIAGDGPLGWMELAWVDALVEHSVLKPRNTMLRKNVFWGFQAFNPDDEADGNGVFRAPLAIIVENAVVFTSSTLGEQDATVGAEAGVNVIDFGLLDSTTPVGAWTDPWAAGSGNVQRTAATPVAGTWAEPFAIVPDTRPLHVTDWQKTILSGTQIVFPPGMVIPKHVE